MRFRESAYRKSPACLPVCCLLKLHRLRLAPNIVHPDPSRYLLVRLSIRTSDDSTLPGEDGAS